MRPRIALRSRSSVLSTAFGILLAWAKLIVLWVLKQPLIALAIVIDGPEGPRALRRSDESR